MPSPLQVTTGDVKPKTTTEARMTLNLDAREPNVALAFNAQSTDTYSGATSMSVFDGQGIERTLSVYFQKITDNTWTCTWRPTASRWAPPRSAGCSSTAPARST